MLLTDAQIRRARESGQLVIENFSEGSLQGASYDMRLGEEAISSTSREKVNPAAKGLLTIPAGDFALVATHERLQLTNRMAGHIGLRSHYARKGLVLLSGPQVDPGFRGVLVIGLHNVSPSDVVIPYKEPFCTVEFYELNEDASEPYSGKYQDQRGISGEDLETLVEAQGMTFGQVIKTLNALAADVKALAESVNTLKWLIPILVAAGFTMTSIVVGVVVAVTQ